MLKPIAQAYDAVLPEPRARLRQQRLQQPAANRSNARQQPAAGQAGRGGDRRRAASAINTTVGLLGCFDVAAQAWAAAQQRGLRPDARPSGAAGRARTSCCRCFGPSTVRDAVGRRGRLPRRRPGLATSTTIALRNSLLGAAPGRHARQPAAGARSCSTRPRSTATSSSATRYLQRRRNLVYDGNPPRAEGPDDDDDDEPQPRGRRSRRAAPRSTGWPAPAR
ncbi:MAG: VacJ family lipoprotein [Comamonadaceae bacterium]|nr:VacJ family lipoprotein [Comamonadaceae bacterium]